MCGRYMLESDLEDLQEQYKIQETEVGDYKKGEIYPSHNAPIVLHENSRTFKTAKWGFPLGGQSKLVINARSESIAAKAMFKHSYHNARCIIPANLFYEWKDEGNKKKIKHDIYLPGKSIASLGGIFKLVANERGNKEMSFVIITTEANSYMKNIHSRMPLIIENEALDYWLGIDTSNEILDEIIKSNVNRELKIERTKEDDSYEQMKLF